MATAKKLPSGNYRVRVFDSYGPDGKKIYKSITAPSKKQAELLAAQYSLGVKSTRSDVTVGDAVDRYIESKSGVLSVSTIRGYRQVQKKYFDQIESVKVDDLTTEILQKYVSSITGTVSAKTVSNIYGLLISSITMFRPDAVFKVSLPKRVKPKKVAPSSEQVQELFRLADDEIRICIALAAFGSLRRGEICGLRYGDITGNIISIHGDMVEDEHNNFHYKEIPKTSDSVRNVRVPNEVIALIKKGDPDEFIIKRSPNAVTHAFTKIRNKLGLNICFHDLRHYFASIGAVMGVPDVYLSDFGGWRRGSSVMKEIYQNVIEDEKAKYQQQMSDHFASVLQQV